MGESEGSTWNVVGNLSPWEVIGWTYQFSEFRITRRAPLARTEFPLFPIFTPALVLIDYLCENETKCTQN
jgi:hypothetical protein